MSLFAVLLGQTLRVVHRVEAREPGAPEGEVLDDTVVFELGAGRLLQFVVRQEGRVLVMVEGDEQLVLDGEWEAGTRLRLVAGPAVGAPFVVARVEDHPVIFDEAPWSVGVSLFDEAGALRLCLMLSADEIEVSTPEALAQVVARYGGRVVSLPASRVYRYVGPEHVLERVADLPPGARITRAEELVAWLRAQGSREEEVTATFTVGLDGVLCVADRHAEHVACAGFRPVLAAGEMTFAGDPPEVVGVTNQSTGYCPEPECWRAVAAALDRAGFRRPDGWTAAFVFRRCPACGQRNLVKDDWWRCAVCDAGLPRGWNF